MMNLVQSTLTVSFSQIPGLRSRTRKMKSTTRSAANGARILAANCIGAQLAGRHPATAAQESSPTRDDANFLAEDLERQNMFDGPLDDGGTSDSEHPNLDSEGSNSEDELSLTKLDSDNVEGHQLWEKREKAWKKRVERRQQRKHDKEEQLWGQEIRQEKKRQEEEDRCQEAQSRQLEEERHRLEEERCKLEEDRHKLEEHRQQEEEHRQREEERLRQEDEVRHEAEAAASGKHVIT